jgi:hypothetical protein
MKTTKLFFMAALALMTAACSNDDNDLTQQPAKAEGIPFTATISLDQSATTRALTENGTTIEATWATGEKVALIYTVSATTYVEEAEVTPQGDGTATISTTLEGSPADDTDVTIVYPASAVDGTTKDVKTDLLASQNGLLTGTGSIAEKYELRKTTTPAKLKIDGTTASLKGTVSLTNQNAIFKLTLKDIDGANDVSATSVVISDQTGVVTTVTPASGFEKVMYVALPTTATTLKFLVTGSDSKKYFNMASSLSLGASYYQSTVKLATVGDVILSTGKCAKAGTSGAVAKIAYLGNDAETSTANTAFKNGLALALSDVSTSTYAWCSQTANTCLPTQYNSESAAKGDMAGIANTDYLIDQAPAGHTHAAANAARHYNSGTHPTGTSAWFLPSAGQWDKMATTAGGYNNLGLESGLYWSSSERYASLAWYFSSFNGNWYRGNKADDRDYLVRACLAF